MTAIAVLLACLAGCSEPEPREPVHMPERVTLGIDCDPGADANGDQIAYAVSLPDDVLTECEGEPR